MRIIIKVWIFILTNENKEVKQMLNIIMNKKIKKHSNQIEEKK